MTYTVLIHMNGRVYDYNLGRFMSVDPFIQMPESSQSINPYSYIMNNPMAGVDPTGYVARGTNASNWRTSGCDFDPMGCSSTPVEKALDTYVGSGQSNMHQSFSDNLEKFNQRMNSTLSAIDQAWTAFADAAGTVTITDLPNGTKGAAASTGLFGKIDKNQLGNDEGNSQEVYDEAVKFFKTDKSYMGEKVEFEDKYAVSIRSVEDHSKTYAPKLFNTFEEANKYAGTEYGAGYEKVWVNGYHYGGVSTIYRSATFAKNGYTGVERTIQYLAHESKHYNRAKPSQAHKHTNSHQYLSFDFAADAAVKRYRNSLRGESQ